MIHWKNGGSGKLLHELKNNPRFMTSLTQIGSVLGRDDEPRCKVCSDRYQKLVEKSGLKEQR